MATNNMERKTIGAAKFKEQCLSILDDLDAEGIVVTKHGRPVARITPIAQTNAEFLKSLTGDKVKVKADIMSTGVQRDATR